MEEESSGVEGGREEGEGEGEEDGKKEEVFGNETVESKNSTEDTSVQEHNGKEEEVKEEGNEKGESVISKLTCKQCKEMEIKWVMECGAVVCGKCIGNICLLCKKKHLTRLYA